MIRATHADRDDSGFTLIELLILIIVLGILAAIVVYAIGTTASNAVEATCNTAVRAVEHSGEAINTKSGSYPASGATAEFADTSLGGLLKEWPAEASADFDLSWNGAVVQVTDLKAAGGAAIAGNGHAGCANLS